MSRSVFPHAWFLIGVIIYLFSSDFFPARVGKVFAAEWITGSILFLQFFFLVLINHFNFSRKSEKSICSRVEYGINLFSSIFLVSSSQSF
jgi:hypothetical protein